MAFSVAGITYRASRPNARAQYRLLRRVSPILPALSAFGLSLGGAGTFSAVAALASADEEKTGAALDECLALVEQMDGEAWSPIEGLEALPLQHALAIVAHVVAVNFLAYFEVKRPEIKWRPGRSIDFDPVFMPDGMDWLYRPMVRGLCRYESLIDGSLHIEDVAEMNAVLDATDENQIRAAKAAEAKAKQR